MSVYKALGLQACAITSGLNGVTGHKTEAVMVLKSKEGKDIVLAKEIKNFSLLGSDMGPEKSEWSEQARKIGRSEKEYSRLNISLKWYLANLGTCKEIGWK